jgi:hypothetical protein
MLGVLVLVGAIGIGWGLMHGLRTGTMDVPWIPYAVFARDKQPLMFWTAAVIMGFAAAGGAIYSLSLMGS